MNQPKSLNSRFLVLTALLQIANELDACGNAYFTDCTFKQWYFMLVITHLFEKPPTLRATASALGTSHQNAKQIAVKLQEKNYLRIEKDKSDSRSLRLVPTRKYLMASRQQLDKDREFALTIFKDVSLEELTALYSGCVKIEKNLKELQDLQSKQKAISQK